MTQYMRFFVALLFLSLIGCSSVPPASKFNAEPQKKMQAARHWDILAEDIAGRIKTLVEKNPELSGLPVFLETPDVSPFGLAFRNMLKYNLFNLGITLSESPDKAISVTYQSQILHHNANRVRGDVNVLADSAGMVMLGGGAALGLVGVIRDANNMSFAAQQSALYGVAGGLAAAGLIEMAIESQYTSITNTEFIFLLEIKKDARLYDMYMDIYYINAEDAFQYYTQINAQPLPSDTVMSGKTIRAVSDDNAATAQKTKKGK